MVLDRLIETKEVRRVVNVVDDDVDVAVVVEIGEGGAARSLFSRNRWTKLRAHVGEAAVVKIAVDHLRFPVSGFRLQRINFRIHMAVDEEQIEPAIVVEIEESSAPPEPPGIHADAARERQVFAPSA